MGDPPMTPRQPPPRSTQIRVVLFDLDRTLVQLYPEDETLRDLSDILNALYREQGVAGACRKNCGHDGYLDWYRLHDAAREQLGRRAIRCNLLAEGVVTAFEMLAVESQPLAPGALALAKGLVGLGVTLGLVTSNGHVPVERFLTRTGLRSLMTVVQSRPSPLRTRALKPSPWALRRAIGAVLPSEAEAARWYVGDSVTDMEAAVRAGCFPIGVASGRHNRDQLETAGARHVVNEIGDLTPAQILSTAPPQR